MIDDLERMRVGEMRPIYAQVTAASGTLTVAPTLVTSGTPPAPATPCVTLRDASGAVVASFDGVGATGYDEGALAAPRVWYVLDTAGLAAGFYSLEFVFSALGSDGLMRRYEPVVGVLVETVA